MAKVSAGKKPLGKRALGAVFNRRNAAFAFLLAVGLDGCSYSGEYGAAALDSNSVTRPAAAWYRIGGLLAYESGQATKSLFTELNGIAQDSFGSPRPRP